MVLIGGLATCACDLQLVKVIAPSNSNTNRLTCVVCFFIVSSLVKIGNQRSVQVCTGHRFLFTGLPHPQATRQPSYQRGRSSLTTRLYFALFETSSFVAWYYCGKLLVSKQPQFRCASHSA